MPQVQERDWRTETWITSTEHDAKQLRHTSLTVCKKLSGSIFLLNLGILAILNTELLGGENISENVLLRLFLRLHIESKILNTMFVQL